MLENGTRVFGDWIVEEKIGSGAFGTVYKIINESDGAVRRSALKVISIPPENSDVLALKSEGMTKEEISAYYSDIAISFMEEIKLLEELKDNSNIVCYEDHCVERSEDGMSFTLMIKMELLTPLKNLLAERPLTAEEVLKLGVDMCTALEVCESKKIIHRDIKPDNIFVSDSGAYKLGDFGVARTLEKTVGVMSQKGTYTYMAPEVFLGKEYNQNVDLYSLGILLYQLLNKNRTPFLPEAPHPIRFADREEAQKKRMSGELLPWIKGLPDSWNGMLVMMCHPNPKVRFQNATIVKERINNILALGDDFSLVEKKTSVPEDLLEITVANSKPPAPVAKVAAEPPKPFVVKIEELNEETQSIMPNAGPSVNIQPANAAPTPVAKVVSPVTKPAAATPEVAVAAPQRTMPRRASDIDDTVSLPTAGIFTSQNNPAPVAPVVAPVVNSVSVHRVPANPIVNNYNSAMNPVRPASASVNPAPVASVAAASVIEPVPYIPAPVKPATSYMPTAVTGGNGNGSGKSSAPLIIGIVSAVVVVVAILLIVLLGGGGDDSGNSGDDGARSNVTTTEYYNEPVHTQSGVVDTITTTTTTTTTTPTTTTTVATTTPVTQTPVTQPPATQAPVTTAPATDSYYGYTYLYAGSYSEEIAVGETVGVLIYISGDIPQEFGLYVEYHSNVDVEWGDWLSDGTSCYLYITGVNANYKAVTVYLKDANGNIIDTVNINVDVY